MADVEFTREEAQSHRLPMICLKCGAPATEVVEREFSTDRVHPVPPADALGCLILGPILGLLKLISWSTAKTMSVRTPLCGKHAKGWFTKATFEVNTITDDRIILTGASDKFAKAWKEQRTATETGVANAIKIRCRACQSLNEESARFCNQCGEAI